MPVYPGALWPLFAPRPALLVEVMGFVVAQCGGVGNQRWSGLVPLLKSNRRLAQNLFHKRAVDGVALVRVWGAYLEGFLHELVPPSGHRPREAKAAKPADQFSPGDRVRHRSRGS